MNLKYSLLVLIHFFIPLEAVRIKREIDDAVVNQAVAILSQTKVAAVLANWNNNTIQKFSKVHKHKKTPTSIKSTNKSTVMQWYQKSKKAGKCFICHKSYTDDYLLSHIYDHSNISLYKCDGCQKEFGNRFKMYNHFNRERSTDGTLCDKAKCMKTTNDAWQVYQWQNK